MRMIRSFFLPMIAVTITFWGTWAAKIPATVPPSSMESVRQEAERGGYRLIEIESLQQLYHDQRDDILLVDTRQEWEHRAGYIDGSVNFPMEPTWRAMWQRRGDLKALLGPEKDKSIIFY